jgi:AmmeMemoRadiSam system protein A
LLSLARKTIETYLSRGGTYKPRTDNFSETLRTPAGAFVTLHEEGKLRGCIGQFQPTIPLFEVVQEMAIASATRDSRFMPVTSPELGKIQIEISVLTPMKNSDRR